MPTLLGAVVFLALCAGVMIPLERLFPRTGHRQPRDTALLCIALFVANTLLMSALGPALLAPLARWCESGAVVTPARLIAAFVAADLLMYLLHRMMHRVPWLWRFHRVHHSSTELTWLEAWRQHPLDFALHGIVAGIPGAILGASLSEVVALVLVRKAWTSFLHADVRLRFGFLERVVATPAFHREHHLGDSRDAGRNFAGTFPLWDALFGTGGSSSAAPAPHRGEAGEQQRDAASQPAARGSAVGR